jgi:hypothetical protein
MLERHGNRGHNQAWFCGARHLRDRILRRDERSIRRTCFRAGVRRSGERRMTYNFDPERWYESRLRVLEARRVRGEIDQQEYERLVEDLDRSYEEMLDRLDGTFQIPPP